MYKVLIVEDDPMVAMINEQYIEKNEAFHVVEKTGNGEEALKYLEKNTVDLIIMDVYMPRLSGIETLREIRARNINAAVIMVTAANDGKTFEEAMTLGAIDYLVKPFAYERFNQALIRFKEKESMIHEGKALNQHNIDKLLGASEGHATHETPKGIQDKTKDTILSCLAGVDGYLTGDEIAKRTGLSSVTVRRYMNHLTEEGDVTGVMNYETGGRPSMGYKIRK